MNKDLLVRWLVFASVLLGVISCADNSAEADYLEAERIAFYKKIKADYPEAVKIDTSLYYFNEVEGNSMIILDEDSVKFTYASYDMNNNFIDSTAEGEFIETIVGEDKVVGGILRSLTYLKEKSDGKLIFSSEYGFGDNNYGAIDPYTSLIYEIFIYEVTNDEIKTAKQEFEDLIVSEDVTGEKSETGVYLNMLETSTTDKITEEDEVILIIDGIILGNNTVDLNNFKDTIDLSSDYLMPGIKETVLNLNNKDSVKVTIPFWMGMGRKDSTGTKFFNEDIPAYSNLEINFSVNKI